MLRLLCLFLVSLLVGCNSLDDDSLRTPQWQASYFVVRDTSTAGQPSQLLRINADGLAINWLSTPSPTALAANDAFLWLPVSAAQLLRHDLARQQSLHQTLPEAMASIAMGQRYILLGAAASQRLYVAHQVLGLYSFTPIVTDFVPSGILYNAGKFVAWGHSAAGAHALLIDEASLAVQRSWLLPNKHIIDASYTNLFQLRFIARASPGTALTQHGLDPGAATFDLTGTSTTTLRAQDSPYAKTVHTGNYLDNVSLDSNLRLSLATIPDQVLHFDVDFAGGVLYYQKADSLIRYDLHARRRLSAWQLPYSNTVFLGATHHYTKP